MNKKTIITAMLDLQIALKRFNMLDGTHFIADRKRKRMRIYVLMFCLLFCQTAMAEGERNSEQQTQTIAHRGDWRPEGSAQNSRASLRRALDRGIFGSEIDVWLTRDGHIMVDHDGKRDGLSIQDTTFAACRRLRLSNGETMPQLKDLLKILKKEQKPHPPRRRSKEPSRPATQP